MAKLFFSYSHKDEVLRNELQIHLEMLRRSGAIETWHDRMIPAGDEFDTSIKAEMEKADVILLLVSSDFLASRYCYDVEVKRAMERHHEKSARVIPVILRPCDWKNNTPFKGLNAAPTDGKEIMMWPNQDAAFLNVVTMIRSALTDFPTRTSEPVAPRQSLGIRPQSLGPRSSNLMLAKKFTEADQDRFMDEAFDYIAKFFQVSLDELKKRNAGIDVKFKQVDAECFTSVIYQNGDAVSRCSIQHGSRSAFGKSITYSHSDTARGSSCNEMLSIDVGEQSLGLKPMGMSSLMQGRDRESRLSCEGAAEMYWSLLMAPLQR